MKKIFLFLALGVACNGLFAQQSYDWDSVVNLISRGIATQAQSLSRSYLSQAQQAHDGINQIDAAFYLTVVDYAVNPDPADSAINRYTQLTRQLQGPERAIAGVLLVQSYKNLIDKYYWTLDRNPESDDPSLPPLKWSTRRMTDTINYVIDSVIGGLGQLKQLSSIPHFTKATSIEELRMALIATTFSSLCYSSYRDNLPKDDTLFREAMLNPLSHMQPLSDKALTDRYYIHQRFCHNLSQQGFSPDVQLKIDLIRLHDFATYLWSNKTIADAIDRFLDHYSGLTDGDDLAQLYEIKGTALWRLRSNTEARDLFLSVEQRFPNTPTAQSCYYRCQSIERPDLELETDAIAHSQRNRLMWVKYSNLDTLHLRVVKKADAPKGRENRRLDSLLHIPAVKEWIQPLTHYDDYRPHQALIPLPMLPQGSYLLVVSDAADTTGLVGTLSFESADPLFIAIDQEDARLNTNNTMGWLVDRATGEPLARQKVTIDYKGPAGITLHKHCRTDNQGFYDLHPERIIPSIEAKKIEELYAHYHGYRVPFENRYGNNTFQFNWEDFTTRYSKEQKHDHVDILLDKPIYRLGEEVQFSCVMHRSITSADNQHTSRMSLPDQKLTVVLRCYSDTIAVQELATDAWGQCSGSFTIPADGRNGSYYLRVYSGSVQLGYTHITVEAYKPPRFTVTLSGDGQQHLPGKPITVKGMASSYNGSSMGGSRAEFHIVSRKEYGQYDDFELHDTVDVADDGSFEYTFTPAFKHKESDDDDDDDYYDDADDYYGYDDDPLYAMLKGDDIHLVGVQVMVLAPDGEEHRATIGFHVGDHSGYVAVGDKQGNQLQLLYNDLDHRPLEGPIHVVVEQLQQPAHPLPQALMMRRHPAARWQGSEAEFRQLFPQYAYCREDWDSTQWRPVARMLDTLVEGRLLTLPATLPSGSYRVVLTAGDSISRICVISHTNPRDHLIAGNTLLSATGSNNFAVVHAGDTIHIQLSSGYSNQTVYCRALAGPRLLFSKTLTLNDSHSKRRHSIDIHVTDDMEPAILVTLAAVREGNVRTCHFRYKVVKPDSHLVVSTESFRDKLTPGTQEQWSFRVRSADTTRTAAVPANLSLTLYDYALNQVSRSSHSNHIDLSGPRYYRLNLTTSIYNDDKRLVAHNNHITSPYPLDVTPLFKPHLPVQSTFFHDVIWVSDTTLHANGLGTFKGMVIDSKTEEPLPFANVILMKGERQITGSQTDFDGLFTIKGVNPGYYDLKVSSVGYNTVIKKNVEVKGTGFTLANIKIVPSSMQLECVQIVSDKVPVIDIGSPESGVRLTFDESIVATVGGVGYDDGSGRKRAGVNVPKSAIAEIAPIYDPEGSKRPEPSVPMRQNLTTTAFFLPALHTDDSGRVTCTFTVPDALTQWALCGVAWSQQMQVGYISHLVKTQKELMVQPQVPRFFRQADTIDFRTRVSNLTDTLQQVRVTLQMLSPQDKETTQPSTLSSKLSTLSSNPFLNQTLTLDVPAHSSRVATFRFRVPDTLHVAQYRITARSRDFSDGEQAEVPVLSNRKRVSESRMLYINGNADGSRVEKRYPIRFNHPSAGAADDSLTLLFCSNPAAYALQAVPHLARQKNPSSIYLANQLYVQAVECLVKGEAITRALKSAGEKVASAQNYTGGWNWMPDRREDDDYTTRRVMERLGQLRQIYPHLLSQSVVSLGTRYLNRQMVELDSLQQSSGTYSAEPSYTLIDNLYVLSLFSGHRGIDTSANSAVMRCYQRLLPNRARIADLGTRAKFALAAYRLGDTATARSEALRLKEISLVSDEMGRYWRDNLGGLYWWERPLETQALMVDLFADVMHDWTTVAQLQQWILKQRQSTVWSNDIATASAIKALTRQPDADYTAPSAFQPVEITLRGVQSPESRVQRLDPQLSTLNSQLSNDYTFHWSGSEAAALLKPGSEVILSRTAPGISWGALFYDYEETLDKIPHNEMGIKISKKYYLVEPDKSLTLVADTTTLRLGDRLRVVIALDCDRTIDRLTLIDQRAATFEPLDTRSGWRYNHGLSYYVDMRNEETRFYIHRIVPGSYTAEYDVYLMATGTFSAGIATIESTYAPEFRSNTPSTTLQVK